MPPLFGCFPVCMTLTAIGLVGALVVVTGAVKSIPGDNEAPPAETRPGYGPPRWWAIVLIAVAVASVYVLIWWLADDKPPS